MVPLSVRLGFYKVINFSPNVKQPSLFQWMSSEALLDVEGSFATSSSMNGVCVASLINSRGRMDGQSRSTVWCISHMRTGRLYSLGRTGKQTQLEDTMMNGHMTMKMRNYRRWERSHAYQKKRAYSYRPTPPSQVAQGSRSHREGATFPSIAGI